MSEKQTKETTILTPNTMTQEQAQRCFIVGMNMFMSAYKGGVITTHATGENIVNMIFYNEEGRAIIDFINAIHENKAKWEDKKAEIEKTGNNILEKI